MHLSLVSGIFWSLASPAQPARSLSAAFREESKKTASPDGNFQPSLYGAVVETSVVPNVPNFAVRGSVRNTDTKDWDVTEIRRISFEGVVVNKTMLGRGRLSNGQTGSDCQLSRGVP